MSSLLGEVIDPTYTTANLIVRMLYGCGLRVSEPLNLRIKDVLTRLPGVGQVQVAKERTISLTA